MTNLTLSAGIIFLQSCTETSFCWRAALPIKRRFKSSYAYALQITLEQTQDLGYFKLIINFTELVVKDGPEFSAFDDIVYTVEDM